MYKNKQHNINTKLSNIATRLMWFSREERANPRCVSDLVYREPSPASEQAREPSTPRPSKK